MVFWNFILTIIYLNFRLTREFHRSKLSQVITKQWKSKSDTAVLGPDTWIFKSYFVPSSTVFSKHPGPSRFDLGSSEISHNLG